MSDGSAPAEEGGGEPPPRRWRGAWPSLVMVALLALSMVELPVAPEPGLDASYWQVLVRAHDAGLQFGPDVAFTYGPLGYLRSPFAVDGVPTSTLVWRTLGALALAGTLVALLAPLPPARRALVWALLVATSGDEQTLVVCATLLVVQWLAPAGARAWQGVAAIAWLAFLSHVKLTFLFLAVCGVAAAATTRALAGERRAAAALPLGFGAAFLVGWVLAGQAPTNLPTWLRHGLEVSSGFVRAMGVDHLGWRVWTAGHVTLALAAVGAAASLRAPGRAARAPVLLFLVAVWYLAWKHGFVRADAHVVGFFLTSLLLALALPPHLGVTRWSALDLCPLACVLGLAAFDASQVQRLATGLPGRVAAGARTAASLGAYREALAAREAEARARARRPDLQALVGRGTIDVLGHEQALVLMNGLELTPRPVFQSYSAYTPALLRLNRRFFRSARAPEFVLARLEAIDGRFPAQEDALALAELRARYDVVHETLDDVLLRRRPGASAAPEAPTRELLLERTLALGEELELPPADGAALWLEVDARPTLRGRLRTLAVSEARLELVVTDEAGASRPFRLIPAIASEGFLVQPLLERATDLAAFLRGAGLSWTRSVRLDAPRRHRGAWASFTLRVWRLPHLPVRRQELASALVRLGVLDTEPLEVRCGSPLELLQEEGRTVVQVHAPGQLVLRRPGARRLTGWFGLRRGVVAPCDGVEFLVRLRHADREEVVWRRRLDPLERPGDAGAHPLQVDLPAGDYDVVLETHPGPAGDERCDWSYWSQLRFEP